MRDLSLLLVTSITLLGSLSAVLAIDAPTSLLKDNPSIPPTRSLPNHVLKEGSEAFEEVVEYYTAFAGKFFPILSKLVISPKKARKIWKEVSTVIDMSDLVFIFFIGWLLVPLVRFPYERLGNVEVTTLDKAEVIEGKQKRKHIPFSGTYVYLYLDHLSRACKVAALVYLIDCLAICIDTMGFNVKNYSQIAAKVIYTIWIFSRFRTLKDYLVEKKFHIYRKPMTKMNRGSFGRATIVSKVSDAALLLFFAFSLFDVLQVKAGGLLKSFFAVGGAGTLVLTVACKDIATDIVSGLSLQASDKVYEGERIVFGRDGKEDRIGTISRMVRNRQCSFHQFFICILMLSSFTLFFRVGWRQILDSTTSFKFPYPTKTFQTSA
jgi:small-conductance mechanosensitive channel